VRPWFRGGEKYAAGSHRVLCDEPAVDDTGRPRVIVLAHRLRPNGIASVRALHLEVGNRKVVLCHGAGGGGGGGKHSGRGRRAR